MIQNAAHNEHVPGVVVGVGSEVPARTDPARFRRRHRINRPFAIYIGRIDANKGCAELFDYFQRYAMTFPRGLDLVLIGKPIIPVPKHHRIHHLGLPVGRGQVRRARRRRPADHAVVLREPVDGRARSLGARPSGPRQRPLRRAQGAVHPQQRRALLRELRGVRRDALLPRIERAAARAPGRRTAATTSRATTPGR